MAADIHKVIRLLGDQLELLPDERARCFVRQMVAKLDQFGDTFFCTPKQHKFLRALYGYSSVVKPKKPESMLEGLRARKASILKRIARQGKRLRKSTGADAINVLRVVRDISENMLTVKMTRDKNRARQMKSDPRTRRGKMKKKHNL